MIPKIIRKKGESDKDYMLRVALAFVQENCVGAEVFYDDVECDGYCFCDDVRTLLNIDDDSYGN